MPGLILWVGTVVFFLAFLRVLLTDQRLLGPMMGLGLIVAILWLVYINLPSPVKKGARWVVKKSIDRRKKGR
ncbi:MAG: hypothetical protein WAU45_02065 [Blastocatellia bacterium]